MKKIVLFSALLLMGLVVFNGCSKKASEPRGRQEISEPFSTPEYFSDNEYFRATGQGQSPRMSTARKIAETNARRALADEVQSRVKAVTDQYVQQRNISDATEVSQKFEDMTRIVVNQELTNATVFDRKTFQEKDGSYTHYVAIQMPLDPVKRGIENRISKDEKLRQDYDKKKFEETFNSEMEKMEGSGDY